MPRAARGRPRSTLRRIPRKVRPDANLCRLCTNKPSLGAFFYIEYSTYTTVKARANMAHERQSTCGPRPRSTSRRNPRKVRPSRFFTENQVLGKEEEKVERCASKPASHAPRDCFLQGCLALLIRNAFLPGPYSRSVSRVLRWGGRFLMSEVPL